MRISFYLILVLSLVPSLTHAQPNIDYHVAVKSSYLESDENIQVYLPKSYENGDQRYPVLYILDGQWFFYNGVGIQETLRGDGLLPELIIIGVDFKSRTYHDSIHNNHWDELGKYIEEELTSFVDEKYRTTGERIIFGWETPAFMVCEFLFRANPKFSGFIASNGGYVEKDMLAAFQEYDGSTLHLFLANSKKDIYTIKSSDEMANELENQTLDKLVWKYSYFNEETHESLAYTSLYQGLRFYYHNYSSRVFSDTQEFYDKGGLDGLKRYFEERSVRFGTEPEIDRSTKNSLIWLAWKTDDFPSFELFMNEFSDVLTTRRYQSSYWQNRLGQYYLKYGKATEAVKFFSRGIEEYPDDKYMAQMNAGLGSAYAILGEKKRAKSLLRKAIKLAQANNDPQLQLYTQQLTDLK